MSTLTLRGVKHFSARFEPTLSSKYIFFELSHFLLSTLLRIWIPVSLTFLYPKTSSLCKISLDLLATCMTGTRPVPEALPRMPLLSISIVHSELLNSIPSPILLLESPETNLVFPLECKTQKPKKVQKYHSMQIFPCACIFSFPAVCLTKELWVEAVAVYLNETKASQDLQC